MTRERERERKKNPWYQPFLMMMMMMMMMMICLIEIIEFERLSKSVLRRRVIYGMLEYPFSGL